MVLSRDAAAASGCARIVGFKRHQYISAGATMLARLDSAVEKLVSEIAGVDSDRGKG